MPQGCLSLTSIIIFCTNYPECNDQKLSIFGSPKDVLCYLDKEVPLCKWCTGDGQVESYPWSCSINVKIEDYIIDNSIVELQYTLDRRASKSK